MSSSPSPTPKLKTRADMLPEARQKREMDIYRKHLGTPQYLVNLSRQYTGKAITTLAEILEDDSQPVVARIKCAELLLDRGYGKAPQAVLVADANDPSKVGVHGMSVLDRIKALKEAKNVPTSLDLEASEVQEVLDTPLDKVPTTPTPAEDSPI